MDFDKVRSYVITLPSEGQHNINKTNHAAVMNKLGYRIPLHTLFVGSNVNHVHIDHSV